jgi:hypothetical protein
MTSSSSRANPLGSHGFAAKTWASLLQTGFTIPATNVDIIFSPEKPPDFTTATERREL